MKILVKLFFIFYFLIMPVYAHDILVLPADLLQTKENYYSFTEPSEIIAGDIIKEFNKTNGILKSFDLYGIKAKFNNNTILKNALIKYKNNSIDYEAFKTIGKNFGCNYILLVNSSVMTNKNSFRRNLWEVLEVATAFDIIYPYRLETSVVLLDSSNELAIWSNNYSSKLGTNSNEFFAQNIAEACAEYEKIKLYSKTVVAPSVSQNIMLRFFPKSIRPLQTETNGSGGALKYERTIPEKPTLKPKEEFYGDMLYGI